MSPDEAHPGTLRLRLGWRILGQSILLVAVTILFGLPVALLALFGLDPMFLGQAGSLVAVTISVFVARRWLDRRSISSLGLVLSSRALRDLAAGLVITGLMMGLIFLIEWLAGWLHIDGLAWETAASPLETILAGLAMLVVWIAVGWGEELYARGYLLQNLEDGLNTGWAVALSSLVFALAHLLNPNVSVLAVIGLVLAGLFLAYAYLRTRQLWLPIGLHIGWNFFEGTVFGFPVSGLDNFRFIQTTIRGPELFTGGAFGPEAGLVLLAGLALGSALVYAYTAR